MTVYCTYSDINYLPRLLALLESLRTSEASVEVLVLALDDQTDCFFSANPKNGIQVATISSIENRYPRLIQARANRSKMEFVFTLTPFLIKYALETADPGEVAVFLDADLFFFQDPVQVLECMGESDVGIIPHSYSERNKKLLSQYGTYNVGWVGIRNSRNGHKCADWWAERCLEWCEDVPVEGKYADQGYLDQFLNLFENVKVLENRGFNLAPWNTSDQVILKNSNGLVTLGDHTPLNFFHFHGLKRFGKWMITSQLNYRSPASKPLMEHVYKPYLRALQKAEAELEEQASGRPIQKLVRGKGLRKWVRTLLDKLLMFASVITGNAVDMSKLK